MFLLRSARCTERDVCITFEVLSQFLAHPGEAFEAGENLSKTLKEIRLLTKSIIDGSSHVLGWQPKNSCAFAHRRSDLAQDK